MASKTPVTDMPSPVVADAPVVTPAPKADPVPAKAVAARIEKAVEKVAAPVVKAAAKITIPAPVETPVAKKKAVVKAAPEAAVKTVKTLVAPAIAQAKTVATKEVNIMEATIKNAAEKAKSMFADANAKSTQAFGEANDFAKGNIEAMVESGKIAAKGIEVMGQDAAEYGRKQFEGMTAVLKSLSSIKSPTDFFKLQSDYVRTSFDSMVAQTSKNTEAMLKLAGEVAQPLQGRVTIAVDKVKLAA